MAAIHLAKKALFGTSKPPRYLQTTTTFWTAPFSTAYHHAQGTNAVAEGRNVTSVLPETTGDTKNNARTYKEVKADEAPDIKDDEDLSGVTGFVADTARQGVIKAMETVEAVGDTVRTQAMDSAYDVTTKRTEDVKDTIVAEADNNVVDTSEYRSIQDAANSKQTETYE